MSVPDIDANILLLPEREDGSQASWSGLLMLWLHTRKEKPASSPLECVEGEGNDMLWPKGSGQAALAYGLNLVKLADAGVPAHVVLTCIAMHVPRPWQSLCLYTKVSIRLKLAQGCYNAASPDLAGLDCKRVTVWMRAMTVTKSIVT